MSNHLAFTWRMQTKVSLDFPTCGQGDWYNIITFSRKYCKRGIMNGVQGVQDHFFGENYVWYLLFGWVMGIWPNRENILQHFCDDVRKEVSYTSNARMNSKLFGNERIAHFYVLLLCMILTIWNTMQMTCRPCLRDWDSTLVSFDKKYFNYETFYIRTVTWHKTWIWKLEKQFQKPFL